MKNIFAYRKLLSKSESIIKMTGYTIRQLRKMLLKREVTPSEITNAYLSHILEADKDIQAYLTLTAQSAIKEAANVDSKKDYCGLLSGIPYALKDNICTKGITTTAGSKTLCDFVPCYDATVVSHLKNKNAILLGKLNMDEFSMGNSTKNSAFKVTKNPINKDYVPGGSSGGCAAAVSADMAPFAIGSDTGGSIRQPASFCGIVGMKPTYGAISRYGLIAFASSLDHIGIVTKNTYDNAMVFSELSVKDLRDSTSIENPAALNCISGIDSGIEGLKIAYISAFQDISVSPQVKESVNSALLELQKAGASVEEINMPILNQALNAYYIISSAEASSNLARYDGIRYGYSYEDASTIEQLYQNTRNIAFGSEVKRRILLGTFVLSNENYYDYYLKALSVKNIIKNELNRAFEKYDVIISPTTPQTAFKFTKEQNPVENYKGDCFTVIANLAGLPAISVPCGKDSHGLPIGMQIMGKAFSENVLYKVAYTHENIRGK